MQKCNVAPNTIMGVAGVGSALPQDAEDMGGAKNRRVAVFVLVSKASAGPSQLTPADSAPMAPAQ